MQLFSKIFILLLMLGCVKSQDPIVSELVATQPPSFSGQTSASFKSLQLTYTLIGQCDPQSRDIEESCEGEAFKSVPGGCVNGSFSSLRELSQLTTQCRYRGVTQFGVTNEATASIQKISGADRLTGTLVQTGHSDEKSLVGSSSLNIGESSISSTNHSLSTGLINMVYGND